jgi:endo-1,4-beta-xylanase
MRRTGWFEKLGENYLDIAFRVAHSIDPTVPLALNQDLVEMDSDFQRRSRDQLLELAQRLKSRGVPVSSIGVQGHLRSDLDVDAEGLEGFFKSLASLDLSFMVTELDIDDRAFPAEPTIRDRESAALVRDFLQVALAQPRCEGLFVWELSDRNSWLVRHADRARPDHAHQRPTLLDEHYRPKPMFDVVVDLLRAAKGPGRYSVLPQGR